MNEVLINLSTKSDRLCGCTAPFICKHCPNNWECCVCVEPPELTACDIQQLKAAVPDQWGDVIANHPQYPDGPLKVLARASSGHCRFFNINNSTCDIYPYRPLLCRLFPLDVCFDSGKYFWIVYHEFCSLAKTMHGKTVVRVLDQLENLLALFSEEELSFYATKAVRQFSLFRKGEWKKLAEMKSHNDIYGKGRTRC